MTTVAIAVWETRIAGADVYAFVDVATAIEWARKVVKQYDRFDDAREEQMMTLGGVVFRLTYAENDSITVYHRSIQETTT